VACGPGRSLAADASPRDRLAEANVVWKTPSEGSWGSMPLGNGDVGINLWVEAGGDLVFLVSKTDAWDAHCRLLKLGRVRLSLEPNPFAKGLPFRQELRLREGRIDISAGRKGEAIALRVWVDAHRPVIRVEGESAKERNIKADLEIWRSKPFELTGRQRDAARGVLGAPYPLKVPADRTVDAPGRVVWYHRNVESCWPVTLKVQGLGGLLDTYGDPLLHRTFGGAMVGAGLAKSGPTTLKSPKPVRRFGASIYALTKTPATEKQWLTALDRAVAAEDPPKLDAARKAHEEWWLAFWDRSWIHASGTAAGPGMSTNRLPLRIGADSEAGNRFGGDVAEAMVLARALSAEEVADLAARRGRTLLRDAAAIGCWTFEKRSGGALAGGAGGLPARVVGQVDLVEAPGGKAVRLSGQGYLEVAHHEKLDLRRAITLAAWVRPQEGTKRDGRILDKSRAGTSDGYLLDTWPGGTSLRMITQANTLGARGCLKAGVWSHVAATFDSSGSQRLYVDGRCVASARIGGGLGRLTQAYALQRFVNACGGRGAQPIKFNGTIFTVDGPGYGPDYRRWGGCFWWQNTRLPYWPMLPAGDVDLMEPLFRMYRNMLALRKDVTRTYYKHAGAFFAETMYFWGTPCNDDHRWQRAGQPDHLMLNRYIRREWQGGLELSMMMLDRYDYTRDRAFATRTLVPFAAAALEFYAAHYPREKAGTLRIDPAQSLETWWQAVNPMPEVAGLHAVLPRMLALPEELTTPAQRKAWRALADCLPPIPIRTVEDRKALAPAATFADRHNCENPELYAIFPYRLYGLGRPGLDVARWAFEKRRNRINHGWAQDPVQAAMLGLADEAAAMLVQRSANKHAGSRFPAFWGPNFDWIPDQDHGGNIMMGLQAMLLQPVGRKLLLLPAWPRDLDVHFKLHAPGRTVVECVYADGKVRRLVVTPAARRTDVKLPETPR